MENTWNKIREIVTKLRGLTTLGIADVTGNAITAILWLYIANLLGAESYGEISYFLAIAGIVSTISLAGAGNTLVVYTAKNVKIQPPIYLISLIFVGMSSTVLFFIFYNTALSLVTFGYAIFALVISEILGRKLYNTYAKYVIIQKILMTALAIGLFYVFGSSGVILGIGISFLPYLVKIYDGFKDQKIDFSLIRSRFGFIINSFILDVSNTFIGSIDKIIIAPLFGFALLGNYQLAIQFLMMLYILPNIFYNYLLPREASGIPTKRIRSGAILISVVFSILGLVLSPVVLPILFPKFTNAILVLQIVSLAVIPHTINLTLYSKFLGLEKIKIVFVGSGIFLCVQISSIIVLGQLFGINGVAVALVLAELAQTAYFLGAQKIVKISMS